MKTINLMATQIRPQFNQKQAPPTNPPLNDAIQIRAAEYWLSLGEPDEALRELEKLSRTWNHPVAVKIRVAAVGMLQRTKESGQ